MGCQWFELTIGRLNVDVVMLKVSKLLDRMYDIDSRIYPLFILKMAEVWTIFGRRIVLFIEQI